jgi:hypothetical protein
MKYRFILACCLLVWTPVAGWSAPDRANTTVSLDLKETPLHRALATLFESSGRQYSIAADVPNPSITLKVQDMPFQTVLRSLLRLGSETTFIQGAGVVRREPTYHLDNGLYQIELRRGEPPAEPAGIGGISRATGIGGVPAQEKPQVEKVPVHFLRANEAFAYLSQQPQPAGIVSIQPLARDNSLIVRGEPDAIQDVKRLLQLADVPPRPFTVSAGISGPGLNGVPLAIRSMARTLVGDDVTIEEEAVLGAQPAHMKVTLQTQLLGDGNLQIASNWDISVPIAGGPKGPIRLVKRLSTTTQLRPGEQVSVAEVDLSGWGGKGVLRLWVRGDWGQPATPARQNRPQASTRQAD